MIKGASLEQNQKRITKIKTWTKIQHKNVDISWKILNTRVPNRPAESWTKNWFG